MKSEGLNWQGMAKREPMIEISIRPNGQVETFIHTSDGERTELARAINSLILNVANHEKGLWSLSEAVEGLVHREVDQPKAEPKAFWMVYRADGTGHVPTVRHETRKKALDEATRLTKQEGKAFLVLKAKDLIEPARRAAVSLGPDDFETVAKRTILQRVDFNE